MTRQAYREVYDVAGGKAEALKPAAATGVSHMVTMARFELVVLVAIVRKHNRNNKAAASGVVKLVFEASTQLEGSNNSQGGTVISWAMTELYPRLENGQDVVKRMT